MSNTGKMTEVLAKLREIAEHYDNEEIQAGINAAQKHDQSLGESNSPRLDAILSKYPDELNRFMDGESLSDVGMFGEEIYDYYVLSGDMPYGVAKARTGDPDEWIFAQLEQLDLPIEEQYTNEPNPRYMDTEEQLIGLSGGLNGPKKMYKAAAGGDNPMAQEPTEIEEGRMKDYLWDKTEQQSLEEFISNAREYGFETDQEAEDWWYEINGVDVRKSMKKLTAELRTEFGIKQR
ncbi:MAG: hypothetical protein H8D23_10710 [Candidatus Brocadiales bacterium]|nr:hypothetical protein [Candidatus Brocadiales bacterium]